MAFGESSAAAAAKVVRTPISKFAASTKRPPPHHHQQQQNVQVAPPPPAPSRIPTGHDVSDILRRHESGRLKNWEDHSTKQLQQHSNRLEEEHSGPARAASLATTFQSKNPGDHQRGDSRGRTRGSYRTSTAPSRGSTAGRQRRPTPSFNSDNSGNQESFGKGLRNFKTGSSAQLKRPLLEAAAEDPKPIFSTRSRQQDEPAGTLQLARRKVSSGAQFADLGVCDFAWLNHWTRRFASEWNSRSESKLQPQRIESTIAEANTLLISEGLLGRRVSEVFDDVAAWLGNKFLCQTWSDFRTEGEESSSRDSAPDGMPAPSVPGAQLGQFLVLVNGFLQHKNEDGLSNCVRIEPPFLNEYAVMINELHQLYPKGRESALEDECRRVLSAARGGVDGSGTWTPFILFMVQYLVYLRDYEDGTDHILETFDRLSLLQKRANSALNHTLGYLMLHIVVTSAKFVSYLAITLDKNPQMLRNRNKASSQDEGSQAESLAEGAVNNLRDAFNTCATDRLAHVDSNGKPDGRKRGIYLIANICLKILFQCRKTNNATTFFDSIDTHSPPLSAYPKSQRVTYLYYLGRFHFQHSHFYRAYLALQQAHNESPTDQRCIGQRRLILIYLMASSIICGRLPTDNLFQHLPEAQGMYEHFQPLLSAIRSGNLAAFRRHMDYNSPHAAFFLKYRIFLQLRNRCEVFVWRSLVRKTWILTGTRFDPTAGSNAPLIDGNNLLHAFYILEKRVQDPAEVSYTSSDFDGADLEEDPTEALLPTATSIRSILSSLIEQGLIRGFIHTKSGKFVITGVKQHNGSELAAGFPCPWKVIEMKANKDVPGWKRDGSGGHGGHGGGKVIHLTSARPVGA